MSRTLIVLSPRLGPVLPAAAVAALRRADRIFADASVPDTLIAELGAERVSDPPSEPAGHEVLLTLDRDHAARARADTVIETPEPPGAKLLDAVAVMDRLRSPGGCPWDAEQTHLTLLKYLVEECYELYQAVEDADRAALREELGDVLLQVLFHARVAAEGPVAPFSATGNVPPFGIDEVAADLVAKLIARHPHVFADDPGPADRVRTASDQELRWDELKRAEKRRESSVDGVALSQPAAALVAKLVSRARKAGLPAELIAESDGSLTHAPNGSADRAARELFSRVAELGWAGVDPERELRQAALGFARKVREAESAARAAGLDPHALTPQQWRAFWPTRAPSATGGD